MALILTTSCASLHVDDFAGSENRFELDKYFTGHTRSYGVFENTDGNPRRTFVCDSYGKRAADGDVRLHQLFHFGDGKTQVRDWRIHRVDANHWSATANDMIGVALGEGRGNAFYWQYSITLNPHNLLATVHVRQWMYLAPDTDTLMTRLVITKLGITVSEVSDVIHHARNVPAP
jgi:hypothetical protein